MVGRGVCFLYMLLWQQHFLLLLLLGVRVRVSVCPSVYCVRVREAGFVWMARRKRGNSKGVSSSSGASTSTTSPKDAMSLASLEEELSKIVRQEETSRRDRGIDSKELDAHLSRIRSGVSSVCVLFLWFFLWFSFSFFLFFFSFLFGVCVACVNEGRALFVRDATKIKNNNHV